MLWTIIGIALSVLGLIWTVYGIWSSNKLKKHLLADRDMIRGKILDLRAGQDKHRRTILNDRQTYNDPTRNSVSVRIEETEATLDILDRFAQQLDKLK